MSTIKKVVAYEPRTNATDNPVLDNRKIKLVFTDGTVRTFYKDIDKSYNTIVWLAINKLLTSDYTSEHHSSALRPYVKFIVKE